MKIRSDQTLIHDLRELIAALDRRVPHLERVGERDIARDAQALRRAALERITALEQSGAAAALPDDAREKTVEAQERIAPVPAQIIRGGQPTPHSG